MNWQRSILIRVQGPFGIEVAALFYYRSLFYYWNQTNTLVSWKSGWSIFCRFVTDRITLWNVLGKPSRGPASGDYEINSLDKPRPCAILLDNFLMLRIRYKISYFWEIQRYYLTDSFFERAKLWNGINKFFSFPRGWFWESYNMALDNKST